MLKALKPLARSMAILKTRPTVSTMIPMERCEMLMRPSFNFAKISKKEKEKQKDKEEKKKVKEELGDITTFDLEPYEEKYNAVIEQYKQSISHFKVGRLDPQLFANIFVKIGNASYTVQQLAEIAPKSANTCVLNPFDYENLETLMRAVQNTDYGFQVTKIEKTILITQPQNSAKELKEKLLLKLKKNTEIYKEKLNKIRSDSRDGLKKYEKVIPKDRIKIIENELKNMNEKIHKILDNVTAEKEKELSK